MNRREMLSACAALPMAGGKANVSISTTMTFTLDGEWRPTTLHEPRVSRIVALEMHDGRIVLANRHWTGEEVQFVGKEGYSIPDWAYHRWAPIKETK